MSANDPVIIKGVRDGLLVLLDDGARWPELLADLERRLAARRAFFHGAAVTANLGARILDEPEFHALHALFARFDMTLDVVVSTATQTRAVAGANGIRNRVPGFAKPGASASSPAAGAAPANAHHATRNLALERSEGTQHAPRPAPPALDGEPDFVALAGEDNAPAAEPDWAAGPAAALFVRRTLRSGMRIQHNGDVCILGDVNAGAEVVAGGDVVVWGALRGRVQAGAGGDSAAVVCALLLAPTLLRIAGVASRGADSADTVAPEQARVLHGRILVEAWSGRRR